MNIETRMKKYNNILKELSELMTYFVMIDNKAEEIDYAYIGSLRACIDALGQLTDNQ